MKPSQRVVFALSGAAVALIIGFVVFLIGFAVVNNMEFKEKCRKQGGVYYDGGRTGNPACLNSKLFIEVE